MEFSFSGRLTKSSFITGNFYFSLALERILCRRKEHFHLQFIRVAYSFKIFVMNEHYV